MDYQYGDIMRVFLSVPRSERLVWICENTTMALNLLQYFELDMERLSKEKGMGI